MRYSGTVKWWSAAKGYGFLSPDAGGDDVFCHFTAITPEGTGRRDLEDGQAVEFSIVEGQKGAQAADVRKIA